MYICTWSQRLVMMSASLHTQTGLHCLTIQVLNTRVCFIDIWYTSLTSVHYNLEHGLVIVTGNFSPLNLNYTISFLKVWIRIDVTSHAIPDTVHMSCTTTSKNQFELVTASLNHGLSMWKDSTPQPPARISHFPNRWFVNNIESVYLYRDCFMYFQPRISFQPRLFLYWES